jgi:hypothetical protein
VLDLTPRQISILEGLIAAEFSVVAFPLYANAVGIRKGNYAALLEPVPAAGFRVYGEPCVLLEGNLTVRIRDKDKSWFVWKKQRLEATPERLEELGSFVNELQIFLEPHV